LAFPAATLLLLALLAPPKAVIMLRAATEVVVARYKLAASYWPGFQLAMARCWTSVLQMFTFCLPIVQRQLEFLRGVSLRLWLSPLRYRLDCWQSSWAGQCLWYAWSFRQSHQGQPTAEL
jgi:hypothetical protein